MSSDEQRLRIRRTRQGIVIASVVGSAGLAAGIGAASAQDEASQTGTTVNQVSRDSDADDDYWGEPPPMAPGSGSAHASTRGS